MAKGSFAWFEKRRKTEALNLAQEQMVKALDTTTLLHKAVISASEGKKQEAKTFIEKLWKEEEEVDDLRRSVFNELTNVAIAIEFREDLMHLVKRLDGMADYVKDSARSVMLLLETSVPNEIWQNNAKIALDLVQSAKTLSQSIENLGSDPIKAMELTQKVEEIENQIDKNYLETKKMFIKYADQLNSGALLILNNLLEFMEQAADTCADTADYIRILAAGK
jgi:predicted phosphate transport protein (TIGR00153 family)